MRKSSSAYEVAALSLHTGEVGIFTPSVPPELQGCDPTLIEDAAVPGKNFFDKAMLWMKL
jgi:hypothetical protein